MGDMQHAIWPDRVLVVDLDGTLIRSDMLYESLWGACRADWKAGLAVAAALPRGRAAVKRLLAGRAPLDPAALPYDAAVLERVRSWRAAGGRCVLVTATDQELADRIAAHLGLFDEVHGSDGTTNLKGPEKAAFLTRRFGAGGYAYIGDSPADLAVWRDAAHAITVNAPGTLRRQVEALGHETEHLGTEARPLRPYLRALRPHQWLKNVLVFLPMVAGHQLQAGVLLQSLLAFLAFSLVASSVYVLNDLLDLAADRAHPRKRNRPLASGALSIAHGTAMAPALLGLGFLIAAALGPAFLGVMAVYYLLTTVYSFDLKRRPIVDICALACLYTLRIVAGAAATGIVLSVWLLAFAIFFFFALAAVKRQAELVDIAARGALGASGRGYQVGDLAVVSQMSVASGYVSVLVMALYVNSPAVSELYSFPAALWGICLILLYWISRMIITTHRGNMHDDPVVYAAKDRVSQVCGLLIFALALIATMG
ncbi:prenyltransferase family protein (plasmid) [Rhodovulum sulfidophilum]|uniref:Prenyltransferase family protein n=1 Tax=Rhodovulum sulfidophilum TaxID=35806 RepID=A0A0D6B988_RHOSU|nr:prenyltransferase family protein [Rhodovulum sulfidophilum]